MDQDLQTILSKTEYNKLEKYSRGYSNLLKAMGYECVVSVIINQKTSKPECFYIELKGDDTLVLFSSYTSKDFIEKFRLLVDVHELSSENGISLDSALSELVADNLKYLLIYNDVKLMLTTEKAKQHSCDKAKHELKSGLHTIH